MDGTTKWLAQTEGDCLDLHNALAEALRRLSHTRERLKRVLPATVYAAVDAAIASDLQSDDLRRVLERTSRPVAAQRRRRESRMWDGAPANPHPINSDAYEAYQVQHGEP
jgi:hypothetical protein